jgi:ethanolamine transporter EutH
MNPIDATAAAIVLGIIVALFIVIVWLSRDPARLLFNSCITLLAMYVGSQAAWNVKGTFKFNVTLPFLKLESDNLELDTASSVLENLGVLFVLAFLIVVGLWHLRRK